MISTLELFLIASGISYYHQGPHPGPASQVGKWEHIQWRTKSAKNLEFPSKPSLFCEIKFRLIMMSCSSAETSGETKMTQLRHYLLWALLLWYRLQGKTYLRMSGCSGFDSKCGRSRLYGNPVQLKCKFNENVNLSKNQYPSTLTVDWRLYDGHWDVKTKSSSILHKITIQKYHCRYVLTSCLFCLDSAALLMMN